jgi:excisionase family DNA binding protein
MRQAPPALVVQPRWDPALTDPTDPTSLSDLRVEIYTVREAAVLLGISAGLAYDLVRDGQIPARRLGRRWAIPRARFHDWLNNQAESA